VQFAIVSPVTTDISTVETTDNTPIIYNIQGIRMATSFDQLPKGIYIINGKKVKK